jgi:hypothetical protein
VRRVESLRPRHSDSTSHAHLCRRLSAPFEERNINLVSSALARNILPDPAWLAALGVCLVSAVIVVGWPEAAGSLTRSLMTGAAVTSALAALVLAAQRGGMLRRARELRRAGHYQEQALSFGARALGCADVKSVLQEAVALIAATLEVEYCAVLESVADADDALVLRAGIGWPADSLDCLVVSEDGDLMRADHFATGVWEHESGIGSGISIRLQAGNRAYGLLDVCANGQRVFCAEEIEFLHSMARLVGAAIERGLANHTDEMPRPERLARAS